MTIELDVGSHHPSKAAAIVAALGAAIDRGELGPGARLPTHRQLAQQLGVSIGTVTRAYAEARRRGLIAGEVGRGTFVRASAASSERVIPVDPEGRIDLAMNYPVRLPVLEQRIYSRMLSELAAEVDLVDRIDGSFSSAMGKRYRTAGARWIERTGMVAPPRQVLTCTGFHTSLVAILAVVLRPGDALVAEALSYPTLPAIAERAGLRLLEVPTDAEGIVPARLDELCKRESPRALYVQPTLHSATTVTTSLERREEIAAVAARHDLLVIENDDDFAMLDEPLLPIAAFARDRSILIADPTRALSLGLRSSFLLAPESLCEDLAIAIERTVWMVSPLLLEMTARLVLGRDGDRLIQARRRELEARHALAVRILGKRVAHAPTRAHHLWLELPPRWRSDDFAAAASERGVSVTRSGVFVIGRASAPRAVRICMGAPRERAELEVGLRRIAELLGRSSLGLRPVV